MSDIIGYKPLDESQIELINELKMREKEIVALIDRIRMDSFVVTSSRWMDIALTEIQIGFMSAVKAIANP